MSNTNRPEPGDMLALVEPMLLGELDDAQLQALERWLSEDEPNRVAFINEVHLCRGIRQSLFAQASNDAVGDDAWDKSELEMLSPGSLPDDVPDVMSEVIDQALALRRQHEIEDQANQQLAAQQQEDARNRRFELRRQPEPEPVKRVIVIPQVLVWLGAAAVIGIAATVIYQMSPPATVPPAPPIAEQSLPAEQPVEATPRPVEPGPPVYVARVNDSFDARWQGGAEPGRLEAGASLTLTSGIAEVALEGQASVLVEGPASVEVVDAGTVRLVSGRVVAHAKSTAQPFKLLIDNTALSGQGTVFGVSRLGTGQASTTVFAGSIDLALASDTATTPRRSIAAGQAAKLATDRGEIKSQARATQDDEAIYNRSMAGTRLRPTHTTSSVQFLSTAPRSLVFGELADRDRVRLFCESAGRSVDAAGMLTIPTAAITLGAVPFDKPADSYLLHLDAGADDVETVTMIEGSVTFNRPILAVIGGSEALTATDRFFAVPGTRYPRTQAQARGPADLMSWGIETQDDLLTLSPDRKTLTFRLAVKQSVDQVRILVEAAPPTD